jgi:hypothetical protein
MIRSSVTDLDGGMEQRRQRYGSSLELIGNTPIVPVKRLPIPGTDRPVGEKDGRRGVGQRVGSMKRVSREGAV